MAEALLHPANRPDDPLEIRSYFIRGRNVLLTRGDFGALYVDYYLGLADREQRFSPENDAFLKELVAASVLNAASRPWNEVAAWTVHRHQPPVNFFVQASNPEGQVIGTVFETEIPSKEANFFFADVVAGRAPARRSVAQFEASSGLAAAEEFFQQSEQRRIRIFQHHDEDYVLLSAQPDADLAWLESLSPESIQTLDQSESLSLLEIRSFRWNCGCSPERLHAMLLPIFQKDPDSLFGTASSLTLRCPRCGLSHRIERQVLESACETQKLHRLSEN
jgi:molecular chaperone Hsp33